jgi:hypothetical protein
MTTEQGDKIIKELESLNWKVWELYNIAKGTPTKNDPPTGLAGVPVVQATTVTKASKSLYDQFVKSKK